MASGSWELCLEKTLYLCALQGFTPVLLWRSFSHLLNPTNSKDHRFLIPVHGYIGPSTLEAWAWEEGRYELQALSQQSHHLKGTQLPGPLLVTEKGL